MQPPQKYEDIQEIVHKSIFKYNASDIIDILTFQSSIGPIIPLDHCEQFQIKNAIEYLQENPDSDIIEEINLIFKEYFNIIIDEFMSIPVDLDENYFCSHEFNEDYMWLEKNYFIIFGLWSPRILYLYVNDDIKGRKILYHEHDSEKYTFCPMFDTEININQCKKCPLLHIKEENHNNLKYYNNSKKLYCKYYELVGENDDEY